MYKGKHTVVWMEFLVNLMHFFCHCWETVEKSHIVRMEEVVAISQCVRYGLPVYQYHLNSPYAYCTVGESKLSPSHLIKCGRRYFFLPPSFPRQLD